MFLTLLINMLAVVKWSLSSLSQLFPIPKRYVAVQPPKKFVRLSPETHRKAPAALPGQDSVSPLKKKELDQTISDVWDEIPRWNKT